VSLRVVPMTIREARAFIEAHHRHHDPHPFAHFAIGCADEEAVRGVAIVGRPSARMLCDDFSAEVTRLCTDGTKNACSLLYGAAWRAARALGYRRLVTYTLPEEGGASLRASGWRLVGEAAARALGYRRLVTYTLPEEGGASLRASRVDTHPLQAKLRWERTEEART
jgi:hypothetical protein